MDGASSDKASEPLLASGLAEDRAKVDCSSPPLGTLRNLIIIGLFSFAYTFGLANQAGVVWYFNSYGMSLVYLLVARLIGSFITTYVQVLIGYFGDKLLFGDRIGRRKPFVAAGYLVQIAALYFLASPPVNTAAFSEVAQRKLFFWLVCWETIFNTGSYIMYNPLSSWLIESSSSEADYITITTIPVNVGSLTGGALGLYATLYFEHITFTIIWTCIGVPTLVALIYLVPNHITRKSSFKQPDLIPSIRICMRTMGFKALFFNRVALFSAIGIGVSMISFLIIFSLPFIKHNSQIVPFGIYLFIATIIVGMGANMLVRVVLQRYNKLSVYKWLTFTASALSISLLPISFSNSTIGLYAFLSISVILGGFIASPLYLINSYFTRDLIYFDTYSTNLRRENMFQLSLNLPSGLLTNLLTNIPLTILCATGFRSLTSYVDDDKIESKYAWNEGSIWQMRLYASLFVAVLCYLSNRVMNSYPLTEELTDKINKIMNNQSVIEKYSDEEKVKESDKINYSTVLESNYTNDILNDSKDEVSESMFIHNFSNNELEIIVNSGNFNDSIKSLQWLILTSLCCGIGLIILLSISIQLQSEVGNSDFYVLSVSLVLLISLQVVAEILRMNAVRRLLIGEFSLSDIEKLITQAISQSLSSKDGHRGINPAKTTYLYGYVVHIACFIVIAIYGVVVTLL